MSRCQADESIRRKEIDGFGFPLGVYPVEPMQPLTGYTTDFEPADADEEQPGDWEAWPDRYVFDIVVPIDRVATLWDQLFALMPGRVFPILDFIGHDAFREVDPYMSYEPVGKERVTDAVRRFRPFFFEDGLVGFGAVSDEPFFYAFLDEHKIITVRVEPELKPKVEAILKAFDLEAVPEPAGADAAAHEHRGILAAPPDRPDLLTAEEVVEQLRERWKLVLNIDPDSNVDDDGQDLGITLWRCLARCSSEKNPEDRFAEILLSAGSLRAAEDAALALAHENLGESGEWSDVMVIGADRMDPESAAEVLKGADQHSRLSRKHLETEAAIRFRWLAPMSSD
ncbi:MAG: hypothetical protein AAGA55_01755 [Planctomycetota bacterium]